MMFIFAPAPTKAGVGEDQMGKSVTQQGGHTVEVHTREQFGGTERTTFVDGSEVSRTHQDNKGESHEYDRLENGSSSGSFKKD